MLKLTDKHLNQPTPELLKTLGVDLQHGLTEPEAAKRLKELGANQLPKAKSVTLFQVVLHQFTSPLIYILLGAAVIALVAKEPIDAFFIGLVLALNALIGSVQEWRAEKQAESLNNLVRVKARVKRDGQVKAIDSEQLTLGDVVFLESGMRVPADLRLIETLNLTIDEAPLTGESMPETKNAQAAEGETTKRQKAFAGCLILNGRGMGVVTAIGAQTEVGIIAQSLTEASVKTPLILRMNQFAQKISIAVAVLSLVIFALGVLRGFHWIDILFYIVAMAVSAIPEGLPVAMTIALSLSSRRMSERNVLVRKLAAVEGLGSCTFIASDKTGTLTVDQQTVQKLYLANGAELSVSGEGYNGEGKIGDNLGQNLDSETQENLAAMVRAAILCNEGELRHENNQWVLEGDPMDVALLALAYKAGETPAHLRKNIPLEATIPFEPSHKYAAAYYVLDGQMRVAVKGAPEVVLARCANVDKEAVLKHAAAFAAQGFRALALAEGATPVAQTNELPQLFFRGLALFIDPIKADARESITACRNAGLEVAMITGDHPATALAIAKQLGIAETMDEVTVGSELGVPENALDPSFRASLRGKHIFARVSPIQKKLIVQALQADGHFVAVTGDGVNDAPALRAAHIGVAMGSGTDVAKDSADIIVVDNHFRSIAAGIAEGRHTYQNIRNIVSVLLATGLAEVIMGMLALLVGLPLPFLPVQLLWANLVTNGLQDVAMAFEKSADNPLKNPPRSPNAPLLDRTLLSNIIIGALVMTVLGFGLFFILLKTGYTEEKARNLTLMLVVLMQNVHVFNCRNEKRSLFTIPFSNNYPLMFVVVLAQSLHIGAMYFPWSQQILKVSPITFFEWLELLGLALFLALTFEIYKWVLRSQDKKQTSGKATV